MTSVIQYRLSESLQTVILFISKFSVKDSDNDEEFTVNASFVTTLKAVTDVRMLQKPLHTQFSVFFE